ncbi:propionate catabolism operon regulatory protein PrpR [uncultured Aquimonas sp.]|uniref:propionate catabolism operon regulatory protein PrpR n=1 Tax=uncultured Aquimonas sp. TaxID=385483 RepID=UPI00086F1E9D|nr:propionate catabolism operon regulatory protein PrpR [uncultured Aquimonas sp.]ODU42468.1 MAG: propionate catabolism operon regulatory protein PrpR [Xanthomonadaceae bacterium SCN 69-123]
MSDSPASARLPVIWTASVSRLSQLLREVTPEFDGRARIENLNLGFEDAVRHIRTRLPRERVDVLISAGSNGAYLRNRISRPLVLVRASGFDLMQALSRARRIADRIGVITHETDLPVFAEFQRHFGLDIAQRSFTTAEEARSAVGDLVSQGVRAIVGTGLVTELAEQAGVAGVLMYSADSIRQAFESALDVARPLIAQEEHAPSPRAKKPGAPRHALEDLVGASAAMVELREQIRRAAMSPATVLIQGETGSGKELVAQALHGVSPRRRGAFVAINCGAVPESLLEGELFGHEEGAFTGARRGGRAGLIEAASGGSLFLDEIGEMPLGLQTRLLRVLEEREVLRVGASTPVSVDLRVVAASHVDLRAAVAEGRFRADLFYRLDVLRLRLPPLRERRDDLPALITSLQDSLRRRGLAQRELKFSAEAIGLLSAYAWPGNVRELRNLLERLHAQVDPAVVEIEAAVLIRLAPELGGHASIASFERSHVASGAAGILPAGSASPRPSATELHALLDRHGGARNAVAEALGVSRSTLWRWLRQHDVQ